VIDPLAVLLQTYVVLAAREQAVDQRALDAELVGDLGGGRLPDLREVALDLFSFRVAGSRHQDLGVLRELRPLDSAESVRYVETEGDHLGRGDGGKIAALGTKEPDPEGGRSDLADASDHYVGASLLHDRAVDMGVVVTGRMPNRYPSPGEPVEHVYGPVAGQVFIEVPQSRSSERIQQDELDIVRFDRLLDGAVDLGKRPAAAVHDVQGCRRIKPESGVHPPQAIQDALSGAFEIDEEHAAFLHVEDARDAVLDRHGDGKKHPALPALGRSEEDGAPVLNGEVLDYLDGGRGGCRAADVLAELLADPCVVEAPAEQIEVFLQVRFGVRRAELGEGLSHAADEVRPFGILIDVHGVIGDGHAVDEDGDARMDARPLLADTVRLDAQGVASTDVDRLAQRFPSPLVGRLVSGHTAARSALRGRAMARGSRIAASRAPCAR